MVPFNGNGGIPYYRDTSITYTSDVMRSRESDIAGLTRPA